MAKRRRPHRHRCRQVQWPPKTLAPQNSPAVADGSSSSPQAKRRKPLPFQDQQEQEEEGYAGPSLPEDIWCHIHSLLPLRDAARAACASRAFRWSWRHLPNLAFNEDSLGLTRNALRKERLSSEFARKVDHILKNHSPNSLRTLELHLARYNAKDHRRLDRWLQKAITPGIEKVSLSLSPRHDTYEFPCSLLSDEGKGDSLRHLQLSSCSFSPTAGPSRLTSLVELDLSYVNVKEGGGLHCLLSSSSSSSALERVTLEYCSGITSLKIPGSLRRLGYLKVACCDDLQVVESNAPKLSMFDFAGDHLETRISLGGALRVKELRMDCSSYSCYTRAELVSSSMPDAETVDVHPETTDAPAEICSKSAHLERLYIAGIGTTPFYLNIKYCALVSIFGASHSVEDLVSYVSGQLKDHVLFCSAFGGGNTSTLSVQEERLVEGACHMLKAWLS